MNNNENYILSKYYDLAYRGYVKTSFFPERRASSVIKDFSIELEEDLKIIDTAGADTERYKSKYIDLFTKYLSARTRCISSFIVGPANFPVRRAEKASQSERKRYEEFRNWRDKVLNKITKPKSDAIVKGTSGAVEKLEAKLKVLERIQSNMKEVNKIIRDKEGNKTERIMDFGYSEEAAKEIQKKDCMGFVGYAPFTLTNNNANIRKLKADIEHEKRRLAKYSDGNKEYQKGSAKVVENVQDNRLQLIFDGKPSQETIKALKSNGFRWSPKNMAWQRQLTANALYALKRLDI